MEVRFGRPETGLGVKENFEQRQGWCGADKSLGSRNRLEAKMSLGENLETDKSG